jgi:PPOX class probable F420-dependent enzyme
MSSGPVADSNDSRPAADDYFASLRSARYLSLTALGKDGTLVFTAAPVATDGDRVYFSLWRRSKTWHGLRHTDWVQVAPSTMLGFCRYGPPLDATARPLDGDEACLASSMLADKYQFQHRFLIPLLHRILGRQTVYYDLRPGEDALPPGSPPPNPGRR